MRDGRQPTVAVVDDDEAVRDSLRFLLETAGFAVRTFDSPAAFFSAPMGGLVCLLVDQHMPYLTGLDLLTRLRERGCCLVVALMTGSPSPELMRRAQELGAAIVMEKPLQEDVLMRFLDAVTA
ncbi:MAG: response regulator [Acetobacteraceae bacterium]|nr:response regulator [Acetobacteraceae bacterium]